jgi:hypothetical protein
MTVLELKKILAEMPDETELQLFNSSSEWYGVESLDPKAFKLLYGKLAISLSNSGWTDFDLDYYEEVTALPKPRNEDSLLVILQLKDALDFGGFTNESVIHWMCENSLRCWRRSKT